jgi:hypothetical protein
MALAPLNTNTGLPETLTPKQAQKVGQTLHLLIARSTDQELAGAMQKQELVQLIKLGVKTAKTPALKLSEQVISNARGSYDPAAARAQQIRDAETVREHEAKYAGMTEADIALLRVTESTGWV